MSHAEPTSSPVRRRPLEAFRYPNYRAYWSGTLAAVTGFQIVNVSVGWLVYQLTGSPLYLGYLGLASALPAIVLNLLGGVIADQVDQRRLIATTQSLSGAFALLLAVLTYLERVEVWHILLAMFFAGSLSAFNEPARQAVLPRLLHRSAIMSAVSMNSSIWQGTRIVGPAVAGLLIARFGTAWALFIGCAGFFILSIVMASMRLPKIARSRIGTLREELREGVGYVRRHATFATLIGMTFLNSFFGRAYTELMPVFAKDILAVGPSGLGFLLSAHGIGALTGTVSLALVGEVRRKDLLIVWSALSFGCGVVAFALSGWYPLSLALLFFTGLANAAFMISVMSSLQILVPDKLRGRVMGIYSMTWNLVPLSATQAGAVATLVGPKAAVAIGGAIVAFYAALKGMTSPAIRSLDSELSRTRSVGARNFPA